MPEEVQSFKQVRSVLDPLTVDSSVKAAAFDAFYDSPNEQEFKKRFDTINIPKETKAALWDQKFSGEQARLKKTAEMGTPEFMGRTAVAELPAIGATVGGVAGFGLPGEALGGALGQAAKRAIQTRMGEAPPPQAGEFARDIATEGGKQALFGLGGRAVGAGIRGLSKVAQPLYRSTLSFTGMEDLPARRAATEAGLRLRIPTSEKAGIPKADAFIQQMTDVVNAEIAKAKAAGKMVDTEKVLEPVRAQVAEYAKSLAPTKPTEAAREIERDIILRLGGEEVNVAGPGGVAKQLVPGPRYMDPEAAQEAKRATSRTLRKAYGEEKGPAIETLKAGERGAKEAIEEIAAVKGPNWQEHVAIALKDAIERTLKSKPGWLKTALPEIAGATVLTGMGHTGMAEAFVVGGLVRQALQKPEVMSRLAIALDRAGTTIPKFAEPAVKYGLRFGLPMTESMPPSKFE